MKDDVMAGVGSIDDVTLIIDSEVVFRTDIYLVEDATSNDDDGVLSRIIIVVGVWFSIGKLELVAVLVRAIVRVAVDVLRVGIGVCIICNNRDKINVIIIIMCNIIIDYSKTYSITTYRYITRSQFSRRHRPSSGSECY